MKTNELRIGNLIKQQIKDKSKMKEYKIGERFEHEGKMVEAIEGNSCKECFFALMETCLDMLCLTTQRKDGNHIIFKEVIPEKK